MQQFSIEYQQELEKGRTDPSVLVDGYEFYAPDYVPGPNGFDPADAIERFASQELTWNGLAYRREVEKIGRGDIILNLGEKTNSVSITFSNISRYLATFAQSQTIEGMLLCIRCIAPAVENDSKAMFHGRCDKPGDIDKKSFPLTARQDFGNLNQQAPPRKFTADDPLGRVPSDPLYEGFPFFHVAGSYAFPFVRQSNGLLGRLLGRRTTDRRTEQWSSVADTPYGTPIPEVFGRCQMPLIPVAAVDKGIYIGGMWVACNGPIQAIENVKTQQAGISDPLCTFTPTPAAIHLGDAGGTGTNLGNTCQADLGGGLKYSHTAYVDGAVIVNEWFQDQTISDPNLLNELPLVTALILGRKVPLPDGDGEYTLEGWTDNPVHLARFILTDPAFVNINEGFMEDAANYLTSLDCDEPLMDDSQLIGISSIDHSQAGTLFRRFRSTGLITPRAVRYRLGEDLPPPELSDGPYISIPPDGGPDDFFCPIGQHRDPDSGECVPDVTGSNATQPMLRKRYTANFSITEEIRVVDLLHKIILPSFRGFLRVSGKGRLGLHSEKASSATRLRSATVVGATSLPVLDATPWKSGPELLQGRIVLNESQLNSEVRTVTSADYSTSGNSITLTAADTGGVVATASGATLSGGSTSTQASGTVTISGTLAAGDTVTITIDGVAVAYILSADDTTETVAGMLTAYINATKKLRQYVYVSWASNVITIKCLHGALNVSVPFLKAHSGPIANPVTAPTVAAAGSGSLQDGTYQVAYADVNAIGLTALTLLATVTLLANQKINVTSLPALPAGVTSRQFFVSEKAGSTTLRYQATRTDAADFSINALPLPNAALPPSQNTTAEELIRVAMSFATNSQDVFPARKPSTAVILNDIYLPDPLNGHKYQATSITTGITGISTPTWPTSAGGTVVDGGVTWTEIGSTVLQQAGLTRSNVLKDTFKWPLGSMQSSVNVVEIPFHDATNDFAKTTLLIRDKAHYDQVKKWLPLKIDGSAIDNYNQAYRVGSAELSKNREGDWFDALETGPAGLVLEEGDLQCASDDSGGLINVLTRIEELRIKPNHCVAITRSRKYSTAMFSDDVGSHVIPIASTLRYVETLDSLAEFIDTVAIRESDQGKSGFYISVSRDLSLDGDWRGFAVYADYGDGYVQVAQGNVAATIGEATSTLNDVADTSVLDTTNELTFTLKYAAPQVQFGTVTEADLIANPYRNLFLVGNEYVQAGTIVDNGNRSYTISDLLHARFDTSCVDHSIGERVVYIDGAEVFVPTDPSRIGIEYPYKLVTTNQDVSDADVKLFTWNGNIFKARRPTDLNATWDASGNIHALMVGHPRETELPESYLMRFRRFSDGVLMRDIPMQGRSATSFGAVFTDVSGDGYAENNNVYADGDPLEFVIARASQTITETGSFVEATIAHDDETDPSTHSVFVAVDLIDPAADWDDPAAPIKYRFVMGSGGPPDRKSATFALYDYDGEAYEFSTGTLLLPTKIRIAFVGTQVRYYVDWVNANSVPIGVGVSPVEFPLRLRVVIFSGNRILNVRVGGLYDPQTIYSTEQQTKDNEDNGGTGPLTDITIEGWQVSPLVFPDAQGVPTSVTRFTA